MKLLKTFAALLFLLFFVSFIVVLIIWGVNRLRRKRSPLMKVLAITFGVSWVVTFIGAVTLEDNDSGEYTAKESNGGNTLTKNESPTLSNDNYDFMKAELAFFKITGLLIANEKEYASFINKIDGYNAIDAYEYVKNYRETLKQNESVLNSIDVPKNLPKEYKAEIDEAKNIISEAVINDYSALNHLLKYLDSGSIENLSKYREGFYLIEPKITDQKAKFKKIRAELKIQPPSYDVLIKPDGTRAYYVQAKEKGEDVYFKIIHHLTTSVDSNASVVWIYSPDNKLEVGKRPDDSIDPEIEYISSTGEINYFNGAESTTINNLIK